MVSRNTDAHGVARNFSEFYRWAMAACNDMNDDLQQIFDSDSDENSEFYGFGQEEIDALRRAHFDCDSGSEFDFAGDIENSSDHGDSDDMFDRDANTSTANGDDQSATYPDFDADAPWLDKRIGEEIQRDFDIPQHAIGDTLRPGTNYFDHVPTEDDVFTELFPYDVFHNMVTQTNLYAAQWLDRANLEPGARIRYWQDTNFDEMRAFIALRIAMGLAPRNQVSDYFETGKTKSYFWLTETPNFSRVMSLRRFEMLTSCLHFANNEDLLDRADPNYNPLFKIQPLLDVVLDQWLNSVEPGQHLAIDESMVPFRGRVGFRQYIKSKHHRYGMKAFALCDSATCYCIKYDIYTGGHYRYDRSLGQGCSVVLKLASGMPEGTIFYTDSFYTSPTLAQKFMQIKMGLDGTVQKTVAVCLMSWNKNPCTIPSLFSRIRFLLCLSRIGMMYAWHADVRSQYASIG